jgi:UPF0271 protein
MSKKTIDLNCDLGEGFGTYALGMDAAVMPHISSANIACGWHAGDPVIMHKTAQLAAALGKGCGAHPGYPDLLGFGRRAMAVEAGELKHYLTYQIGALEAFCRANDTRLRHVKPHGSLYHAILKEEDTATAVIEAIAKVDPDLIYVTLAGPKGATVARLGEQYGLTVAREAFPDRAYNNKGTLVPRGQPGAVIENAREVVDRALLMATRGQVVSVDGDLIELRADTLCVHGDTPGAVEMVKKIHSALEAEEIEVVPMMRAVSQRR